MNLLITIIRLSPSKKGMSSTIDKIIKLRSQYDPWWNRILGPDEVYPSEPSSIPLRTIPKIRSDRVKMSDLPPRYHWFAWVEHTGERMYIAYDDIPTSIFEGNDTTVEDLISADVDGYSPLKRPPLVEDIPDDFVEFLENSFQAYGPPFLTKYGLSIPDDRDIDMPVIRRFLEHGLSLVQDRSLMEQHTYHIFCILHDLSQLLL